MKLVKQSDEQGSEAVRLLYEANEELSHKGENQKLRRQLSVYEAALAKVTYEFTRITNDAQRMADENALLKSTRLICSSCQDRESEKKNLEKATEAMEKEKNDIQVTEKVVRKLISNKTMVDRGTQPGHFCHICEKTYVTESNLKSHMKIVHEVKKPVDVKRQFKCIICLASFSTGKEAESHFKSVHEEKDPEFSCNECSVNFTLRIHLERHIEEVHEEKSPENGTQSEEQTELVHEEKSPENGNQSEEQTELVHEEKSQQPENVITVEVTSNNNTDENGNQSEEQTDLVHEEKSQQPENVVSEKVVSENAQILPNTIHSEVGSVHEEKSPETFCIQATSDFLNAQKLISSNEDFKIVVSNSLLETREYQLFTQKIQELPLQSVAPTSSEIAPVVLESVEKCPRCNEDWLTQDLPNHLESCADLTESKKIQKPGGKTDLCQFCNKFFKGQKNLKAHIKRMHQRTVGTVDMVHEVKKQPETSNQTDFTVVPEVDQQNNIERSENTSLENWRIAEVAKSEAKKAFQCTICKTAFHAALELVEHIEVAHKIPSQKRKAGPVTEIHEEKIRSVSSNAVNANFQTKSEPVLPACYICSKKFTRKDTLTQHVLQVHEGVKPFCCPVCKMDFAQKIHLIRHQERKKHTDTEEA